jgi:hypothetical protein
MARRPIGAEPKHLRASRGSSTIGSSAVLKLVLISTGVPVRRSKQRSNLATSGSLSGSTVWMRAVRRRAWRPGSGPATRGGAGA